MKVTFISDTHTKHYEMDPLPGGDILIFSGDCMGSGYRDYELQDFIEWFRDQPYRYKIYVAGNHDRYVESHLDIVRRWFEKYHDLGVRFLCNESIDIDGLKIYGTPYQPYFCGWAFNVPDSNRLYEIYKMIPEDVDILVTHCPPYDILDKSHMPRPYYDRTGEEPLGSQELLNVLAELGGHAPRYHVFGHIHGDGGQAVKGVHTTFINASVCNEGYDPLNRVLTFNIEPVKSNEGGE